MSALRTTYLALAAILISLAFAAPAESKRGPKREYFFQNSETVRRAGARPRMLLHVDTLNSMGDYAKHVAPGTIAIKIDRSSPSVPHTSVRIGRVEYDIMSSRAAGRKIIGRPDINVDTLGALYKVPRKALALYRQHFEDQVKAINRFNLHPFHYNGRQPALLKQGSAPGTWEITNTRRAPRSRIVTGKLVQQKGRHYLESPNLADKGEPARHIRVPVKKRGATLELDQVTCASFVISNLQAVAEANPGLNLPRFAQSYKSACFVAGKISQELEGKDQLAKNRRQDLTTVYRDGMFLGDLKQAVRELAGP